MATHHFGSVFLDERYDTTKPLSGQKDFRGAVRIQIGTQASLSRDQMRSLPCELATWRPVEGLDVGLIVSMTEHMSKPC